METLLPALVEYGVPGLWIGYLLWSGARKDARIDQLTDRLVDKNDADAARFTGVTLTLERILMIVQGGNK